MTKSPKKIFIVAGEASGDLHASNLALAIKKIDPSVEMTGFGGPKMEQAGVKILHDLTRHAVMGFWEVLKHYPTLRKLFYSIVNHIKQNDYDALVLVDYPGFNLRLAKALRKQDIKIIYYISPQIWAWKKNRVFSIKRDIDKVLTLFSFEKDLYDEYQVPAAFVGHPLIDHVTSDETSEDFRKKHALHEYKMTIGLLPGSREKEIEALLPPMIETAKMIYKKYPSTQFFISQAPTVDANMIREIVGEIPFPHAIVDQDTYNLINACDLCMVTSGTATLETALLNRPMIVIYKTSWLTWFLAKMFVKIPHISLVNIVAKKEVVPELLQDDASPENMYKALCTIFTDDNRMEKMRNELTNVRHLLGDSGASRKAAEEIIKSLSL